MDYVVFYPNGQVTIEQHEGVKNIWPVGTMIAHIWPNREISAVRVKKTVTHWESRGFSDLTDTHKAMMLLGDIRLPDAVRVFSVV